MKKVPLVYHPGYNITLLGIQKLHPFDSEKYGHVFEYLLKNAKLRKKDFYEPEPVTREELLLVHSKVYLLSLRTSAVVGTIAEFPLLWLIPNPLLQWRLLTPMRLATGGTMLGAELALKHGWAINLSGGYHHAKARMGGGFCYYADIPVAMNKVWKKDPKKRIMVVDLDAHQGNGHESILMKEKKRAYIMDVYNVNAYPQDHKAKKGISLDLPVYSGIKDREYLKIVEDGLEKGIADFKPDLIIYNAGTDIFKEDPLGGMRITAKGIIKRDEMVFGAGKENNVPVLMVLSGGYTKKSANIIGRSIKNLLENVL